MRAHCLLVSFVTFLAVGASPAVVAALHPIQSYKFTSFGFPGAVRTEGRGINNAGQIVGTWVDSAFAAHGFVLGDGVFESFDVPGALGTFPRDINDAGTIVGSYYLAPGTGQVCCESYGFIRTPEGEFFTIDYPTTNSEIPATWLAGINNAGQIVGGYNEVSLAVPNTSSLGIHSFLLEGETFRPIDFPFAAPRAHIPVTYALDINDAGDIVGGYNDDTELQAGHGFVLRDGDYHTLDMPGGSFTDLFAINNFGDIIGESTVCPTFAFLFSQKRGFMCIAETPQKKPQHGLSLAFGLNDAAQLVGDRSNMAYFATAPSAKP